MYIEYSPNELDITAIQLGAVGDAVLEWAININNNLQLNLGKTKTIVFGCVPYINKLGGIA